MRCSQQTPHNEHSDKCRLQLQESSQRARQSEMHHCFESSAVGAGSLPVCQVNRHCAVSQTQRSYSRVETVHVFSHCTSSMLGPTFSHLNDFGEIFCCLLLRHSGNALRSVSPHHAPVTLLNIAPPARQTTLSACNPPQHSTRQRLSLTSHSSHTPKRSNNPRPRRACSQSSHSSAASESHQKPPASSDGPGQKG